MAEVNPKVFISYTWDSDEQKNWVLKLATNLRSHGVNIILDQWDARLGSDLPFFMEQGLTSARFVICICSVKYVEKANGGIGGAGYEKKILASELMTNANKKFIIPVIKGNTIDKKLPLFLSGMRYVDFDNDSYYNCYQELLERIYDEDVNKKPALGSNPFVSTVISDQISMKLNMEKIRFQNQSLRGKVSFDYEKNSGLYTIGVGKYSFKTKWSECGGNSIYCYNDYVLRIGYNPDCKGFPLVQDFVSFDFSSRAKSLNVGEIIILENQDHKFAALKILKVTTKRVNLNHLLEFEYKVYKDIE